MGLIISLFFVSVLFWKGTRRKLDREDLGILGLTVYGFINFSYYWGIFYDGWLLSWFGVVWFMNRVLNGKCSTWSNEQEEKFCE